MSGRKYSAVLISASFLFHSSGRREQRGENSDIFRATSRSQLEAARARFFAEFMQSSELFS